jgi:hypothetical protein
METSFFSERSETAPASQFIESIEADGAVHYVPSVALPPVQAFLSELCLPPSAHRISQAPQLSPLRRAPTPLRGAAGRIVHAGQGQNATAFLSPIPPRWLSAITGASGATKSSTGSPSATRPQ